MKPLERRVGFFGDLEKLRALESLALTQEAFMVSLHEPDYSHYALDTIWVQQTGYQAPKGQDWRLRVAWKRPRPSPPRQIARPLSIIVPWDEVLDRGRIETVPVVWVPPPPEDTYIVFDIVYTPAAATVTGHPGARSMGIGLVGSVLLANGERVFVTWLIQPMVAELSRYVANLRSARFVNADGTPIERSALLAFGKTPNPDVDDGTEVGKLLSVTRRRTSQGEDS
jgi:hypothetical protein